MVATMNEDLNMEVVLACTAKGGDALWRPVVTSGGVIYDNSDIAALIAAIGSGLPGMFALRLAGAGPFEIPALELLPFQEVRVICTDCGEVVVESVTMGTNAILSFAGTVETLDIQGGVATAESSALTVGAGVGALPGLTVGSLLAKTGPGSVSFGATPTVLSFGESPAPCGTVGGALPGTVTLELTAPVAEGGATGTQTFDGSDQDGFFGRVKLPLWDSGGETNQDGQTFTLFKLPPHSPAFPDTPEGGHQYSAVCAGYGLRPIGCGGTGNWDATMMGMPGSWSCNINGPLHSKTGWSGLAFYESNGNMYGVNSDGGSTSSPAAGTSPVCALAH
eukprot:SAG22_NODE_462_length_10207_cov_30.708647_8_plen_335_part_00